MAAKTQPTRDEWKEIEKATMTLYAQVRLSIDGYDVMLEMGRVSKTKLAICIWVNGAFKGEWCKPGHEIARRFYCVKKRNVFSRKMIADFEKTCGKREAQKARMYETFESVRCYWSSFARLKAHLVKNNDSIVWLIDSAKEAQAT